MNNKVVLKVEYIVEGDNMTDDEYYTQEERVFFITEEMIMNLVSDNVDLNPGEDICFENFFISKP